MRFSRHALATANPTPNLPTSNPPSTLSLQSQEATNNRRRRSDTDDEEDEQEELQEKKA